MVNSVRRRELDPAAFAPASLVQVKRLVNAYVVVCLGTLVALAAMTAAAPASATGEAWGHAVVVAVFAIVLLLRTRAALREAAPAFTRSPSSDASCWW